jgi:hypothetical protein
MWNPRRLTTYRHKNPVTGKHLPFTCAYKTHLISDTLWELLVMLIAIRWLRKLGRDRQRTNEKGTSLKWRVLITTELISENLEENIRLKFHTRL